MRTLPMKLYFLALAMIGCRELPPTGPAEPGAVALPEVEATAARSDLLDAVRRISARFHSERQATKHGYVSTVHCVSSPAGGPRPCSLPQGPTVSPGWSRWSTS